MPLAPNVKVGDYVVKKQLGRGGMAVVWLAEGRGEKVAIKEPRLDGTPEEVQRNIRFVRHEGAVLSSISSDYVCKLYGVQEVENVPYLILEYLDGGSLREYAPMNSKELKAVLKQLLLGLSAVHSRGIIHRDVKPGNVMLKGRKVKLVDFGTAISYQQKALEVVVSPGGYTAPEQLEGLSLFSSDIWSIGATILYLYTRRHPCTFMKGYQCEGVASQSISVEPPRTGDERLDKFIEISLSPNFRTRFYDANEALAFLDGELPKDIAGLVLRIRTKLFIIKTSHVILGRTDNPKEDLKVEGNTIYIYDRLQYISRRHAEIAQFHGQWYVRDLGSTNGTAVLKESWVPISKRKGEPGPWHPLQDGDVIALGYEEAKGPYELVGVRLKTYVPYSR